MNIDKQKEYLRNEIPLTCKDNIINGLSLVLSSVDTLYNNIKDTFESKYFYCRENNTIIYIEGVITRSALLSAILDQVQQVKDLNDEIYICDVKILSYSKVKSIFNINKITDKQLTLAEYIHKFYTFEKADNKMIEFFENKYNNVKQVKNNTDKYSSYFQQRINQCCSEINSITNTINNF
jgi:hypothetical protein